MGLSYATLIEDYSWNQTSHYDLLQALYHEQTNIDPYQWDTGDKVFYRGHWYSARAPGLALFVMPWYTVLRDVDAQQWAYESPAEPGDDEMIYLIGLWGNVLPGLLLLVLVWNAAERLQPGFGVATAVTLGLGTMALALSTLLFSHILTAFLGFAAFTLLLRERDGPPRAWLCGAAGLSIGYAISSEYPLALLGGVLGLYLLSRRDALTPLWLLRRGGAYAAGIAVGLVPLALYNLAAFHSLTHVAYANVPQQHKGFFGITAPSLRVAATLLGDSRGLLTLAPVLVMGALGTLALYRRGRRAEALTIAGVCLCYLTYNSGYYLPFGGGSPGPRFLATTLPFLALPLAIAFERWPGPTIALAAVSIVCAILATITHPLIGYETETVELDAPPAGGLLPAHDRLRLRPRPRLGGDLDLPAPRAWRDRARRNHHAADAPHPRLAARRSARARRLGAVRRAGPNPARPRPPGPARHPPLRGPPRPHQGRLLRPLPPARARPAGLRVRAGGTTRRLDLAQCAGGSHAAEPLTQVNHLHRHLKRKDLGVACVERGLVTLSSCNTEGIGVGKTTPRLDMRGSTDQWPIGVLDRQHLQ